MSEPNISWIEYAALVVSCFMALIAITSAMITVYIYKTSSNPDVIVYAEQDPDSKSCIKLIIKNVGNSPAKNISFKVKSDRGLPREAFGFENAHMPQKMTDGPITTGIPFLAPGSERTILWGQYGGLYQWFGNSTVEVVSKFERASNIIFTSSKIKSSSYLDILSFRANDASANDSISKIQKDISAINSTLKKTNSILNQYHIQQQIVEKLS